MRRRRSAALGVFPLWLSTRDCRFQCRSGLVLPSPRLMTKGRTILFLPIPKEVGGGSQASLGPCGDHRQQDGKTRKIKRVSYCFSVRIGLESMDRNDAAANRGSSLTQLHSSLQNASDRRLRQQAVVGPITPGRSRACGDANAIRKEGRSLGEALTVGRRIATGVSRRRPRGSCDLATCWKLASADTTITRPATYIDSGRPSERSQGLRQVTLRR